MLLYLHIHYRSFIYFLFKISIRILFLTGQIFACFLFTFSFLVTLMHLFLLSFLAYFLRCRTIPHLGNLRSTPQRSDVFSATLKDAWLIDDEITAVHLSCRSLPSHDLLAFIYVYIDHPRTQ